MPFTRAIQFVRAHFTTIALIAGFVADVITFRNLDLSLSVLLLAAHLSIVGGSILFLSLPSLAPGVLSRRVRNVLSIAQQYSTGNLLSAFLILYSASGSLAASAPFLVLLLVAIVGNETLKLEKNRLPFQTSLFFLNLLLFMALAIPLWSRSIGAMQFFLAVFSALAVFITFVFSGRAIARRAFLAAAGRIRAGWISVLILVAGLYFLNLIPPIPLSLKAVGFYHSVIHTEGAFIAEDEPRAFLERFFDVDGTTLRLAPGESAYAYTAVFAPARLDADIVHRWEALDPASRSWMARSAFNVSLTGGRREGYRVYSLSENPAPGRYRLSVETARGQIVGRAYLTVIRVPSPVRLVQEVLE